jgi:predicted RNA-binding Zn-ribbon protein involved in translation (DUF1610 family)
MDFIIIETFDNYIEAHLIMGRLEEAGIHCWLKDEQTVTLNPILSNAIGGIKLMIDKNDIDKATEILNALKEIKRQSFACPHCGSHNIEYITSNRKSSNVVSSILTLMLGSYAIGIKQIWHCYDCNEEFENPIELNNELYKNVDESEY